MSIAMTRRFHLVVPMFAVALLAGCEASITPMPRRPPPPAPPAPPAPSAPAPGTPSAMPSPTAMPSADEALRMLVDGNRRFATNQTVHPHQSPERRAQVAGGQMPFAVVLCCADSRVAPELAFDTGLGDLFTIRVAGNIADDAVVGSIEYAVEHLHTPLVVVVGHSKCGAVQATVDSVASGGAVPGHLPALVDPIRPAVTGLPPGPDLTDRAIDANVRNVVSQLRSSQPVIAKLVAEGKVKVVGGRYDLATGEFKQLDVPQTAASAALLHDVK